MASTLDWNLDFYLAADMDVIADCLMDALDRVPSWAATASRRSCPARSLTRRTPATRWSGPGLRNYWHCSGASIGITQGPGAGKYLAQWMVHGQTEINVRGWTRGAGEHTGPRSVFAVDKAIEEYLSCTPAAKVGTIDAATKTSPLYARLDAKGAQWEEVYGWERPQYFDDPGVHLRGATRSRSSPQRSTERANASASPISRRSPIQVTGADAATLLDRVSANKIRLRTVACASTRMLTELGGIECEMTIARLGEGRYYLNSAIMATTHDEDWLNHHILDGEDVTIANVTDQRGIVAITGLAAVMCSRRLPTRICAPAFRWRRPERSPSPVGSHKRCASPTSANSAGNFTWPSRTCHRLRRVGGRR